MFGCEYGFMYGCVCGYVHCFLDKVTWCRRQYEDNNSKLLLLDNGPAIKFLTGDLNRSSFVPAASAICTRLLRPLSGKSVAELWLSCVPLQNHSPRLMPSQCHSWQRISQVCCFCMTRQVNASSVFPMLVIHFDWLLNTNPLDTQYPSWALPSVGVMRYVPVGLYSITR